MKVLLCGLILGLLSINLHAGELSKECRKEIDNLCVKVPATDKAKCMEKNFEKLSAGCKSSITDKSNLKPNPCEEELKGSCKDKKDEKLIECLKKSKNKKCTVAVADLSVVLCPSAQCNPADYGNDADRVNECYDRFFDSLSAECKLKQGLSKP